MNATDTPATTPDTPCQPPADPQAEAPTAVIPQQPAAEAAPSEPQTAPATAAGG